MKTIQIHSSLSTNILHDFQNVITIEIENKPIAEGAFGEVYICKSVNGKTLSVPQVIKLFKEDNQNRQDHNFNTIQKLQRKIELKNRQIKLNKGKNITDEYPALKGIPQFSFEGSINNKKYRGFSSTNLKKIGFEEFIDVLDNTNLYKSYQKISIDKKMLIAFHLVSSFKLLQEIFFIHADLKPEAIFINIKTNECAIIDFDSGTITENSNDTPNTWGAPNDWVAPEIWEQLKQIGSGGLQKVKVNLLSDLWSVAVGIHYILTTTHPLFYLNELSPRVTKQYFSKYKWPEIQESETYFNQRNLKIYLPVKEWLEKNLPKQIYIQLYNTINYGYSNPIKRTTYNEWEKVLSSVQEAPIIKRFSSNLNKILSGNEITIEWEISNCTKTDLNLFGEVKNIGYKIHSPLHSTKYIIKAENAFGKTEKEIEIEVLPKPEILDFKISRSKIKHNEKVTLVWNVKHVNNLQIGINNNFNEVELKGKQELTFEKNSIIQLKYLALDNKTTETLTKEIEVFYPVSILDFSTNLNYIIETTPVKICWKTLNNSKTDLIINRNETIDVTNKNEIELYPKNKTTYQLQISNDLYNTKSEIIEVNVQKIPSLPKFENIVPNASQFIPKIEIDFNFLNADILNSTHLEFEKIMQPIKKRSLLDSLKSIIQLKK